MPEEGKKEKNDDKIVLRVDMDCAGCREKVKRIAKTVDGVEKVDIDMKEQKVTVIGDVDPRVLCETVRKRFGKRTDLLSPDLKSWEQKKKGKEEGQKKEDKKKEDKKKEEPPDSTVVLKVRMHCGGCGRQISKSLYRMEGVTDVQVDAASDKVTVKGRGLDANELCDRVRRSGKQCEIIPQPKKAEKKEEKKEEKKDEKKGDDGKKGGEKKKEDKPSEEKKGEKKGEGKKEDKPAEEKKEEKAEEKKEKKEKKEEKQDEAAVEIKKYEYNPYRSVPEYTYPPQLFSDENPNACFIM